MLDVGLGTEPRYFNGTDRNASVLPGIENVRVFRYQVSVLKV